MKRIVLGTAGHIDHGKTLLTKALTGVDTDRLAEEKARGITIELGFAQMQLSDGTELSLVDVPGHEKFVRTMMAGVSGIDGVLLVIAVDDGVMPQTREHLDILRLLDLRSGLVVLTKCDLADEARLAAVKLEIAELTRDTFLMNAPICPVSALTGEGIEALRGAIEKMVHSAAERDTHRPLRMPIDRAFQLPGFGTVVTGTLTEGSVRVGDSVQIVPGGEQCLVRSLQTHGASRESASAGMRVAMSFSALSKTQLQRGFSVVEPDSVIMADTLTAEIRILEDCPYVIRNASQLHLFHGTQEQVCKLRLLDGDALRAGESGFAQLKLSSPIPVRLFDRFLLRFFSPVITIGGGRVISTSSARLRRKHISVAERLSHLASTNLEERMAQRLEDAGLSPQGSESLRRTANLSRDVYQACMQALLADGRLVELSTGQLVSSICVKQRYQSAHAMLESFHNKYPLQAGMRLAEWRSRLFTEANAPANALLHYWLGQALLKSQDGCVALADFEPVFTREHLIMQRKLLHYYRDAWLLAPELRAVQEKFERFGSLFEQVLLNMRVGGLLIPLSNKYWVHHEAEHAAFSILQGMGDRPVTLAEFRTAAGISRKYSQLFLEYWDRLGLTKRVGDAHIIIKRDQT